MRLGLHSQLRRRWCEIGVKLVQPQQMRFEWAWLSVCVDVTACRLTWCWQPNLKVASMLETIERFYQAGIRSLIWDNAPAHRAKVVRDTALVVGFLPPFSPELNPVERLFEEVRRHVEGRLYETLQDKVEAVERFLKTLAADTERLRRLIGWDWIIQAGAELKKSVFPEANQAATS